MQKVKLINKLIEIFIVNNYWSFKNENSKESIIEKYKNFVSSLNAAFLSEEKIFPDELEDIFIRNGLGEMYIVLNGLEKEVSDIKQLVKEWEINILSFINFDLDKQISDILKLNINILILIDEKSLTKVNGGDETSLKQIIFQIEKSSKIARKMFLICNEEDIANLNILPFYFEKNTTQYSNNEKYTDDDIIAIVGGVANKKIFLGQYEDEEIEKLLGDCKADEKDNILSQYMNKEIDNILEGFLNASK